MRSGYKTKAAAYVFVFLCIAASFSQVVFEGLSTRRDVEVDVTDDKRMSVHDGYWLQRTRTSKKPVTRQGSGIIMFGYGSDRKVALHFSRMAVEAARTFKKASPGVRMAIVSNLNRSDFDEQHVFDIYIQVREDHEFRGSNYQGRSDKLSRQWLTRLLYLSATPFELTIAYDANVCACDDVLPAIEKLQDSSFDFAVASAGGQGENIFQPHNFALAFRWNELVSRFLDEWFMEQLSTGVALDDQHTLRKAATQFVAREPSFRFRVLNPSLAAAFVSTDPKNGFYPRETRVIRGLSYAIHETPTKANATCEYFNSRSTARQIVHDGKGMSTVHSAFECTAKLVKLNTTCKYAELWNAAEDHVVP